MFKNRNISGVTELFTIRMFVYTYFTERYLRSLQFGQKLLGEEPEEIRDSFGLETRNCTERRMSQQSQWHKDLEAKEKPTLLSISSIFNTA